MQDNEDRPAPPYRNRVKCLDCGEVIESTSEHDFKPCSCFELTRCCGVRTDVVRAYTIACSACLTIDPKTTGIAVDGGPFYQRRVFGNDVNYQEMP